MDLRLLQWLQKNIPYRLLIITLLVVISAISICYVAERNRRTYDQLQHIYHQRRNLEIEWSRLLLQYGTLTSSERIEKLAVKSDMQVADQKHIILVKP